MSATGYLLRIGAWISAFVFLNIVLPITAAEVNTTAETIDSRFVGSWKIKAHEVLAFTTRNADGTLSVSLWHKGNLVLKYTGRWYIQNNRLHEKISKFYRFENVVVDYPSQHSSQITIVTDATIGFKCISCGGIEHIERRL